MRISFFSELSLIKRVAERRVGLASDARKTVRIKFLVLLSLCLILSLSGVSQGFIMAGWTPWDTLQSDSWLADPDTGASRINMYSVNNGAYAVGFDYAKKDGSARGMNSLMFSVGGNTSGHLSSTNLTGGFDVICGGSKTYSDLLVLVSIDADSLPEDFSMSLGLQGQAAYTFNNDDDFCFYDPYALFYDAGRPSGYSSETNPAGSPIAYDFESGMVSIYAFSGLSFNSNSIMNLEYAFSNLPGKAVFSLYALVDGANFVYHTNRGLDDTNDSGDVISTFEVVPEPATILLLGFGTAGILRRRKS